MVVEEDYLVVGVKVAEIFGSINVITKATYHSNS